MSSPTNDHDKNIEQWLHRLGLREFVPVFASQQIDHEVLGELTDSDLKELGLPLGPRKKLLKAIAELNSNEIFTSEADASSTIEPGDAERRHLTVMFCDLVGSTALSSRFDPEDLSDIVRSYQESCARVISQYDGFIARYMGDGMLVYFGYPQAHEDDAERALHAGLEIITRVAQLEPGTDLSLQTRIGIATGLVVVGETIGEETSREQVVMGETPNLAARLQGIADPDQVVVSFSSRQLCVNLFEFDEMDKQILKGFDEPVPAFVVVGERALENRFDARKPQDLYAMVGRDQELALLLQRWQSALASEGQVVVLSGEAGIGKSRIARALADAVAKEELFRINYQCSPYHTDSALYPAIRQLTSTAGIAIGDDDQVKLDKLEALLDLAEDTSDESKALIATLLGLDGTGFSVLELSPQQLRVRTLEALSQQLVNLSHQKPALFVVEDAHWIDATTLELIEMCFVPVASAKILIVITARPEFDHRFGGNPVVTSLTLNRLGRKQINGIIERATRGKPLPSELMDDLVAKTDGVPLFIEELTKTLLESGALTETADAWIIENSRSQLTIPTSLHDSLMARLDRHSDIKDVAQTAACIGREFEFSLLASISPLSEVDLSASLDQLVAAELVFRRGTPPNASYSFKHALVRDAAYESLLKSVRQEMHGKIILALGEIDAAPELMAHHAEVAGETENAIEWWQKAGDIAFARPAYDECLGHLGSAIRLVQQMDENEYWRRKELALQVQLGQVSIAKNGYSAKLTAETFKRALALSEAVDDSDLRFPVLYGVWVTHLIRAECSQANTISFQILELADAQDGSTPRVVANRMAGTTQALLGNFDEARRKLEIGEQAYDPSQRISLASHFGQDPGTALFCYMAWVFWLQGYPDQAKVYANRALTAARDSAHINTICYANIHVAMYAQCRGDVDLVKRCGDTVDYMSNEHGLVQWRQFSEMVLGWASVAQGDDSDITRFQQGFDTYVDSGALIYAPVLLTTLASQLLQFDRVDEAHKTVASARQIVDKMGERLIEPELLRVEGEIFWRNVNIENARACFEQGIEMARKQNARSWELRASMSLAALLNEQGEKQHGLELLQNIYGWFSEGFESSDLKKAKSLLELLS
jgi:predicted ATPase/class 3 adenylate cyclase